MNVFEGWQIVSRRDPRVVELYGRHYSSRKSKKNSRQRRASGITPPGSDITLLRSDCSALFVWLKQKYHANDQTGVYCAVFRNEGHERSSTLILEAEEWARFKWPGERFFTYVDPREVRRKRDPGRCFIKAGWRRCGHTTGGLIVFEKLPAPPNRELNP